jgi:hypothetical protein
MPTGKTMTRALDTIDRIVRIGVEIIGFRILTGPVLLANKTRYESLLTKHSSTSAVKVPKTNQSTYSLIHSGKNHLWLAAPPLTSPPSPKESSPARASNSPLPLDQTRHTAHRNRNHPSARQGTSLLPARQGPGTLNVSWSARQAGVLESERLVSAFTDTMMARSGWTRP